jgi:uncharacterized protein
MGASAVVVGLWTGPTPRLLDGLAAPHVATLVTTPWTALVPAEWDPLKRFRAINLANLQDSDPRSARLLLDMRAAWDNAPLNLALNGQAVRLQGYVVPLEDPKGELKEFLLVPYFGACIHTPPPPANQIVHVRANSVPHGLRMMDAVSVSGVLQAHRQNSVMGMSGYAIAVAQVQRFSAVETR